MEPWIKIIQITDSHLFHKDSILFNVNTNLMFNKIIEKIHSELADTHAIFLTGDLSQDKSTGSYQRIVDSLTDFDKKIIWIPGNHDCFDTMQQVFCKQKNFYYSRAFATPFWDFIFLNTKLMDSDAGFLAEDELLSLETELKKERFKPLALVMHHHPITVDTPLIDHYLLKNNQEFLDIVSQYKVDLIICGHVHNDYSIHDANIHLETAPATCFQFKKGAIELAIDKSCGYKIYYFSENKYISQTKTWTF